MQRIIINLIIGLFGFIYFSCSNQPKEEQKRYSYLDGVEKSFVIKFEKSDPRILEEFKIFISSDDSVLVNSILSIKWEIFDEYNKSAESKCDSYDKTEIKCSFAYPGTKIFKANIKIKLSDNYYKVEENKAQNINEISIVIENKIDILDPEVIKNQSPLLVLNIYDTNLAKLFAIDSKTNVVQGEAKFNQDMILTFDLSQSKDDKDDISKLQFEMNFGAGWQKIQVNFKLNLKEQFNPGLYYFKIKATDTEGGVSEIQFNVLISCELSTEDLFLDISKVKVEKTSLKGKYKFDVSDPLFLTFKGEPLQFSTMWDFNGDGIVDTDWINTTKIVTDYVLYAGKSHSSWNSAFEPLASIKNVSLKVLEHKCYTIKKVSLKSVLSNLNLEEPMADGNPTHDQGPQIGGYTFIQGQILGLNSNNKSDANVNFIAADPAVKTPDLALEPKKVICSLQKYSEVKDQATYAKAKFYIKGMYQYKNYSKTGANHGLELWIDNITNNIGSSSLPLTQGQEIMMDTSSSYVSGINYYTDGSSDYITQQTYQKAASCAHSIKIRVIPLATGSCLDNPKLSYSLAIDGTFTCPLLKNSSGQAVQINYGSFYCEVGSVDACLPGGGGGLPPEPR